MVNGLTFLTQCQAPTGGGGCHGLPTDLTEVQIVVLLLLCDKLQNVVRLAKQLNKLYNCITVLLKAKMCTEFWWGNLRERDHLVDPGGDGRIIFRWSFMKWSRVY